jgi:hypothetical protein
LIVASFDLAVVRLLRDAIRTADLSQAGDGRDPTRCDCAENPRPRDRVELSPSATTIESRDSIRSVEAVGRVSEPSYFRPDVSPALEWCGVPNDCPDALKSLRGRSPIEPPWKVLPWEQAPEPQPKIKIVKIVTPPPDRSHTGALIDCFM